MENKANYAIVGAFVTLVLAGFMAFVYWFHVADSAQPRTPYAVVFDGAVSGLNAGTTVLFNGIPVGTVQSVGINPDNPAQVLARIAVDADAPVMTDTRTLLEVQPLTGMAQIQLLGGSVDAGRLEPAPGETVAVMYGEPSDFQIIMEGARDIVASAEATFSRIESFFGANEERLASTLASVDQLAGGLANLVAGAGEDGDFGAIAQNLGATLESVSATFSQLEAVVADNRQSLTTTIGNAETFMAALASNADAVDGFLASMTRTSEEIGPLADELRSLTTEVRGIVSAVPPAEVRATVADIGVFAETLANNTANIDGFFQDARALAGNLTGLSEGLQATLDLIDEASTAIDTQIIARAMGNLDSFSAALGDNAFNVDEIINNTRVITETLTNVSLRADDMIARIDGMFTAEDGRMLFEELGATAGSIRQLAERVDAMVASDDGQTLFGDLSAAATAIRDLSERLNTVVASDDAEALIANIGAAAVAIERLAVEIDQRTIEISTGITGFTTGGTNALNTIASDAARTLDQLDRVLRQIERNPQVLIFGGDTVRDFRP